MMHSFNIETDLPKLQAFLLEQRRKVHQAAYLHLGDLLWRMYYFKNEFDFDKDLRIWEDANGDIAGLIFTLACEDNPEFQLRPELYNSPVADAMFAWAADRARSEGVSTLYTSCIDSDSAKADLLARHGYTRMADDVMVFMARDMADPLPDMTLPESYTLVSHSECPDLPGYTGTQITIEQYAPIWQAPGYADDLGLRVCYEDREIVAGALCWYDALDASGEFEPVGTAEGHRGKGLAFAVMAQELHNLKVHGANMAYVRTGKDNLPAVRLYEKLGFRITAEDFGWELKLQAE